MDPRFRTGPSCTWPGRPTTGSKILEVWDSKEQADAFNRDVLPRAVEKLGAGASGPEPEVVRFDPITANTFRVYSSEQVE